MIKVEKGTYLGCPFFPQAQIQMSNISSHVFLPNWGALLTVNPDDVHIFYIKYFIPYIMSTGENLPLPYLGQRFETILLLII